MGATNSFIGANFILGQANLVNPSYEIQRWHTVLVAYCVTLFATFVNMWGSKVLDKISKGALIFNIVSFLAIVVTILACNNHKQSASFVFRDFQNFTGFSTSMAGIIGILQPAFGMCCCKQSFLALECLSSPKTGHHNCPPIDTLFQGSQCVACNFKITVY
jgi:choline transport protein